MINSESWVCSLFLQGSCIVCLIHCSVKSEKGKNDCTSTTPLSLSESLDNEVAYSYSVKWVPSKTPWGTRWDHYLYVSDENIHWFR